MAHTVASDLYALFGLGYHSILDAWSTASNSRRRIHARTRQHYVFLVVESSSRSISRAVDPDWLFRHKSTLLFRQPYCALLRSEDNRPSLPSGKGECRCV